LKPEQKAGQNIDRLLEAAGWIVQDFTDSNLGAALGVAVREFPMKNGTADYVLFLGRKAVGVIVAKPEGFALSGVSEQSEGYNVALPVNVQYSELPLPFSYETTGVETFFRDFRDPDSRSRRVFAFHKPETLQELLSQSDTLKERLRQIPPLIDGERLYGCQVEAIKNLEKSFAQSRPRALIQMATGSGKTFTAVSLIYRLIKHAEAK
jgi:type I restriction enzyme R subunit